MKRFLFFALLALSALYPATTRAQETPATAPPAPETPPTDVIGPLKVAFWDSYSGLGPPREGIDPAEVPIDVDDDRRKRIMGWMQEGGAQVRSFRTDELMNARKFPMDQYDVLVTSGDALPRVMVPLCQKFLEKGGVLIAVHAQAVPWSVPLTPDMNGRWVITPFFERDTTIVDLLGLKFGPLNSSGGYTHRASDDFAALLPPPDPATQGEFPEANPTLLRDFLDAPKMTATSTETLIFPLVESRSGKDEDVPETPQVVAVQRGNKKAILLWDNVWSDDPDPDRFAGQKALWQGIATYCQRWKS